MGRHKRFSKRKIPSFLFTLCLCFIRGLSGEKKEALQISSIMGCGITKGAHSDTQTCEVQTQKHVPSEADIRTAKPATSEEAPALQSGGTADLNRTPSGRRASRKRSVQGPFGQTRRASAVKGREILQFSDADDPEDCSQSQLLPIVGDIETQRLFSGANGGAGEAEVSLDAAEGSNSTARLSIYSDAATGVFGATLDETLRSASHQVMYGDSIPFFAGSIFAPHTSRDMVELQRRLEGGYAESSSGRRYLTPSERWEELKREEGSCNWTELRPGAPLPQEFLTGAGILWAHPSIEDGLPVPLPKPDEENTLVAPNQDATARAWDVTFMQLVTHLFRVLPQWESLVWGPEVPSADGLEKCEHIARDFFHRSFEISSTDPSHIRLRLMLSQLYISLRDTIVLLHDPKRYIAAFSKVDPKGRMFQAEVLALHGGGLGGEGKPEFYGSSTPVSPSLTSARGNATVPSVPDGSNMALLSPPIPSLTRVDSLKKFGESVEGGELSRGNSGKLLKGSCSFLSMKKAREVVNMATSMESIPCESEDGAWMGLQLQSAVDLFRRRACCILRYIIGVLKNFVFIKLLRKSTKTSNRVRDRSG